MPIGCYLNIAFGISMILRWRITCIFWVKNCVPIFNISLFNGVIVYMASRDLVPEVIVAMVATMLQLEENQDKNKHRLENYYPFRRMTPVTSGSRQWQSMMAAA